MEQKSDALAQERQSVLSRVLQRCPFKGFFTGLSAAMKGSPEKVPITKVPTKVVEKFYKGCRVLAVSQGLHNI